MGVRLSNYQQKYFHETYIEQGYVTSRNFADHPEHAR